MEPLFFLEGGGSMNTLINNADLVLSYLSDNSVNQTSYDLARSCFRQLSDYLEANNLSYSKDVAQVWLEQQTKSKSTLMYYGKALRQLEDVYQVGHVSFFNRSKLVLVTAFIDIVEQYLEEVALSYAESHLKNIRNRCGFFFGFMQMDRFREVPGDITYADIMAFYNAADLNLSKADLCLYKGTAMNLLQWMSGNQICPAGFAMLLFMGRAKKIVMLEDLPEEARIQIRDIGSASYQDFPPNEFYEASIEFCRDLEVLGYASSMRTTARSTFDLLYLFLDMNQLGYDPTIARIWFSHTGRSNFGTNLMMSRRILSLFEMFALEGTVRPEKKFVYKHLLCDQLPEWCLEALLPFLEQKRKEHLAVSTIDMYRSAATRFCSFLDKKGLSSFDKVDADLLKEFNLTDPHNTVEGKNAYNVRIRKFLFYLAQNGYVHNYYLGEALPCMAAPKTRVVKILSDDDAMALESFEEEDFALGLRNRAIILIGLKMGLRGIDITSLELSQIDWHSQSIRFCQQKTDVGKILPMPVEVGNALYRYLSEGRPESRSRYIFITHKAPYGKVGRGVCSLIMKKALPNSAANGFHITRKTYATERFRNRCGYSEVADLLGHSTTETVHKYLSLDEERMRLCPITLSESGIPMGGGFRNE